MCVIGILWLLEVCCGLLMKMPEHQQSQWIADNRISARQQDRAYSSLHNSNAACDWFQIQMDAPAAPILLAPPNGAQNQPLFVTLQWNAAQGAALYDLHISGDPGFFTTVLRDSTIPASVTSRRIGEIFPGTTLYWRVRAKNAAGVAGAWSAGWSFTTQGATHVSSYSAEQEVSLHVVGVSAREMRIHCKLKHSEYVSLRIVNILGQEIIRVLEDELPAGEHVRTVVLHHAEYSPILGVRLQTPSMVRTQLVRMLQ